MVSFNIFLTLRLLTARNFMRSDLKVYASSLYKYCHSQLDWESPVLFIINLDSRLHGNDTKNILKSLQKSKIGKIVIVHTLKYSFVTHLLEGEENDIS